jgi:tetratricopeptide (TPR) repeat protein
LDAYFLWGTALARLASLNEDPTLADAAADKFQQMLTLSEDGEDGDAADAALGPVGLSLWGSSLLIVATETQSREVLDEALAKFQRAVEVDGGTTFETRFQFAKALKEGGDLVAFLEDGGAEHARKDYYRRALEVCKTLEEIYKTESEKVQEERPSSSSDEEDEDDDKVTAEDFAEAKLLEAVLQGLQEDPSSVEDFHRTLALYQEAVGTFDEVVLMRTRFC